MPPNSQPGSRTSHPDRTSAALDQTDRPAKLGTALALRNEPPAKRPTSDPQTELAEFAKDLRELRIKAGLGYPEMAELSHYTMKTLASAASGLNLPTLPVTAAYVRACDGNVADWEDRWHRLADAIRPPRDGATPEPGPAAGGAAGRGNAPDGAVSGRPAGAGPAGAGPDSGGPDTTSRGRAGKRAPRPSQVASPRPAREGPSAPAPSPPPSPDHVYVITSAAPRRPYR